MQRVQGLRGRRLADSHLAYYDAAHALLPIDEKLTWWQERGREFLERDPLTGTLARLGELAQKLPDDRAQGFGSDCDH
ncbi:MAG TPA: hypothetical protein VM347_30475 [Nonomuraea sp.]|nr:hypothetical protein [Nonomuraea sp.]